MFDLPVFLTVRDRVTELRKMIEWFEGAGCRRITLLDNDSSYPPLLEYLGSTAHEVVWLGANLGPRALWTAGLVPSERFILSDPDLDLTDCPFDAIEHLGALMDEYGKSKVGLGLLHGDESADMPSLSWERRLLWPDKSMNDWWKGEIAPGVFDSLIDTTFALYEAGSRVFQYEAIRTGAPYLARHVPWYMTELDDEYGFYLSRAATGPDGTTTRIG